MAQVNPRREHGAEPQQRSDLAAYLAPRFPESTASTKVPRSALIALRSALDPESSQGTRAPPAIAVALTEQPSTSAQTEWPVLSLCRGSEKASDPRSHQGGPEIRPRDQRIPEQPAAAVSKAGQHPAFSDQRGQEQNSRANQYPRPSQHPASSISSNQQSNRVRPESRPRAPEQPARRPTSTSTIQSLPSIHRDPGISQAPAFSTRPQAQVSQQSHHSGSLRSTQADLPLNITKTPHPKHNPQALTQRTSRV